MPISDVSITTTDNVAANLADGALAGDAHPDAHSDIVVDLGAVETAVNALIDLAEGLQAGTTAVSAVPINAQTGTTYTLVLADAGKLVTCTNESAVTVTVPPNSSVAFAVGTVVNVAQTGAGAVTIAEGAGVTVNQGATYTKAIAEQYATVTLIKTATDAWLLVGGLDSA